MMWFTSRRARGVRALIMAAVYIAAIALAITFSVHGWASVLAPDMRNVNLFCILIIGCMIAGGIRDLR